MTRGRRPRVTITISIPFAPLTLSLIHILFGFHHDSQLQEQVQRQTLNDMRGSMDPVSYTHLDVYKRQIGYSSVSLSIGATQSQVKNCASPFGVSNFSLNLSLIHI